MSEDAISADSDDQEEEPLLPRDSGKSTAGDERKPIEQSLHQDNDGDSGSDDADDQNLRSFTFVDGKVVEVEGATANHDNKLRHSIHILSLLIVWCYFSFVMVAASLFAVIDFHTGQELDRMFESPFQVMRPLVGIGIALFIMCLFFIILPRDKLRISDKYVEFQTTLCSFTVYYRIIPINEVYSFERGPKSHSRSSSARQVSEHSFIILTTLGMPLHFGGSWSPRENAWLIEKLNRRLKSLKGYLTSSPEPATEAAKRMRSYKVETLRKEGLLSQPPHDAHIMWNEEEHCFAKVGPRLHHRLRLIAIPLFTCALCVSVFPFLWMHPARLRSFILGFTAGRLQRSFIASAVFSVILGVALYVAGRVLFLMRCHSKVQTRWKVGASEISQETCGSLLRSRKTDWTTGRAERIDLRRFYPENLMTWFIPESIYGLETEPNFMLKIYERETGQKCYMKCLTEGEARHIAWKIRKIQS